MIRTYNEIYVLFYFTIIMIFNFHSWSDKHVSEKFPLE